MVAEQRHEIDELCRQEKIASCVASIRSKQDFPAFSQHVQKILAAADEEENSIRELTPLILRDYALTLKLLRAANQYNYSGRNILSVAHAVVMLGQQGVRNLASSMLIFEHFHNKPAGIRELMMLSMLSANHVRGIGRQMGLPRPEEAYLCGMVRNLGELLCAYYLPAQYAKILSLVQERQRTTTSACKDVLQFTFEELGQAIVKYWGMPDRVGTCFRPLVTASQIKPSADDLLHVAVTVGHTLTTAVYRMEPAAGADELKALLRRFHQIVPLAHAQLNGILQSAIKDTQESFAALSVHMNELRLQTMTANTLHAMEGLPQVTGGEATAPANINAALVAVFGEDTESSDAAAVPPQNHHSELGRLAREVCSVVQSSPELEPNTLILMVLEAILRGLSCDRVIFAFSNVERTRIEGRFGLGDNVDQLIARFRFPLSLSGGPVALALQCKRTVIINVPRTHDNRIARFFGAKHLGLLPIVVAHKVLGCFYFESAESRPDYSGSQIRHLDQLRHSVGVAIMRMRNLG